ncbi:MAG: DUF5996 family protein [Gemmataceae bacterium]
MSNTWPALPLADWQPTYTTLQRWTQIVGKIRTTLSPWINHSWSSTLYVTARGLSTGLIPYQSESFELNFDFIDHCLLIKTSAGGCESVALKPRSVAKFYGKLNKRLNEVGIQVQINTKPNELADAIHFENDNEHSAYDPEAAHRFWRVLVQCERVFTAFRARFIGKCSPVHFFWGAFDLAVTRFSGRPAPPHPGGVPNLPDWIVREAYSHEVCSAGFWPGGGAVPFPAFYSYAYPEPAGYRDAKVRPTEASYNPDLREFVLPYDAVRQAASQDEVLMEFLQSTYEAAADLGKWDRAALERSQDPRHS